MTIDEVANEVVVALDGVRSGNGWKCLCPAHADTNPSLSLTVSEDRLLVRCHAGCTQEAVLGALRERGLSLSIHQATTTDSPTRPKRQPRRFDTFEAAYQSVERYSHCRYVTHWVYRAAHGGEYFRVGRFDLNGGGKEFRPFRQANGHWQMSDPPGLLPLYRLPELLAHTGRVYIAEGEKCVEAATSIGLFATTSSHGSKSPKKTDWSPLAGRDVVVLPDSDSAGAEYAEAVAAILLSINPPATVRIVEIPGLPAGGDIADWIEEHDSREADDLHARIELLTETADVVELKPEKASIDARAFQPFPVAVLPEPLCSFVCDGASAIACDPSYIALPLLAALAAAIGNTWRVALTSEWSEPCVFWCGIIGESGTAKSPAIDIATRPIRRRQSKAMGEYNEAKEVFTNEALRYEIDLAEWKRQQRECQTDPPVRPEEPKCQRFWCSDTTVEALADRLSNAPRGLLVLRDELSGFLRSFGQYKGGRGGDVENYLTMHGARDLLIDRKGGDNSTIHIPAAAVSICGAIQPEMLRRVIGTEHEENGFLARFLVAMPPRRQKRWAEGGISRELQARIDGVFDRLFGLEPHIDDAGKPNPKIIALDSAAKRSFRAYVNRHGAEQFELVGAMASTWSKLEGYTARLALVLHFARWAAGDSDLVDENAVDGRSVAAALELTRWFGHEARRVYEVLHESVTEKQEREIVNWITRKGGAVTPRQVQGGLRAYRTPGEAEKALETLVKQGMGRWTMKPISKAGGRPSKLFTLTGGDNANKTHPEHVEAGCVDADSAGEAATPGVADHGDVRPVSRPELAESNNQSATVNETPINDSVGGFVGVDRVGNSDSGNGAKPDDDRGET